MTADQVATAIELAIYRASDRLARHPDADGRPVSLSAVAVALRDIGYEIAAIRKGHEESQSRKDVGSGGFCVHGVSLQSSCAQCAASNP